MGNTIETTMARDGIHNGHFPTLIEDNHKKILKSITQTEAKNQKESGARKAKRKKAKKSRKANR